MKSWPRVCIFINGVIPAVSPKSYAYVPRVSEGHEAGSTARISGFIFPFNFSLINGKESPAKFEPPPVQPTNRSGVSPTLAICFSASSPIIVWCIRTWFKTEPSAYAIFGSATAASTASEIAIPKEPDLFLGSRANLRPAAVNCDGERCTTAPKTSIINRRYGFRS